MEMRGICFAKLGINNQTNNT